MDVTNKINLSDLFSAKDLVIVLTGGGSGLGAAITLALCQSGAKRIYILGRRLDALQKTATNVDAKGDVVTPIPCDVTDPASVSSVVKIVESEVGYVDVLINNAGINGPRHISLYGAQTIQDVQSIMLRDYDQWDTVHAVNTNAVVGVAAAFLHLLDAGNAHRGWASGKLKPEDGARKRSDDVGVDSDDLRTSQIITTSSIAGFNRFITAGLPYASSKAGATHLGKVLAHFLAPWGIRSNVICPGVYPTEMTAGHHPTTFSYTAVPAGRQGSFEDISGMILFMVGKSGAYLNGAVQVTDGGRLSVMPGTF